MEHYRSFIQTIASEGFNPPDHIAPGKFYRYAGLDKKPSNKAGYCRLFDDGKAGVFGDFSTGFQQNWFDGDSRELTLNERMKLRDEIRIARGHRDADIAIIQGDVADEAQTIWTAASTTIIHPYPVDKKIIPYNARQADNALLVPMYLDGKLVNLQRIYPNTEGNNKFPLRGGRVTGCYMPIGELSGHLYICEGYATGCSLHEYTGLPVAVAFNANGLRPVAITIRKKYPDLKITIAADNDAKTPGNPGLTKARGAAAAVGGNYIYPVFDHVEDASGLSDFNDYVNTGGIL